jgi:CRP-like cAMP-binding protein
MSRGEPALPGIEAFSHVFNEISLLEMVSPQAASLLRSQSRQQELPEGALAWDVGDEISDFFFPISGMISVRVLTSDGHAIEVAAIGRQGAVGLYEQVGRSPVLTQGVVAVPGRFARISGFTFGAAVRENPEIRSLAAACDSWLLRQSQQIAACNAAHSADCRFCRYLLRASDALAADVIPLTQEAIAQSLGIRRTTATLIAQDLQQRGMISYRRGKIVIGDRTRLEAAACDCYAMLGRCHWPSFHLTPGGGGALKASIESLLGA